MTALLPLGLTLALGTGCPRSSATSSPPPRLLGHLVRVDAQHKLLAWSPGAPYATVARLAWETFETRFPVSDNGQRTWLTFSRFDPDSLDGVSWPHNPAGLYAMLADSAVLWYAFSGDADAVAAVRTALDYQLRHGTTPDDWDWARVPYASAGAGDLDYHGADDEWCDFCGRGDGIGVIEPDKVGELGFAYLQMFEITGEARYRDASIACADALAKHVRPGDELHSPWPFRVYAETNVAREEYSSNVVATLDLFDGLVHLGVGDVEAYARARAMTFDWLMRVPMKHDTWSGYFEDIAIQTDPRANPNQYSALRTARWLITHPEDDAQWHDHAAHLIAWAVDVFGRDTATERGVQWGATVMSEQRADMSKMASHTARLGATLALWSAATGDDAARDRAARSLNWATYACGEDGVVAVSEVKDEGWWFSDGYGDYIRHFLLAMGAQPQWAPAGESHIVRSTSIVVKVAYTPEAITWSTFDDDATETLRLPYRPSRVQAAGRDLPRQSTLDHGEGFSAAPLPSGDVLVRVRHRARGPVVISSRRVGRREAGAGEALVRPPRRDD